MTLISNLFNSAQLKRENEELKEEVARLRKKVNEKQTHIDRTNAYWKGVLRKTEKQFAKS
jgi:hypothetical protein